jgi:hypothetical protein
MNMGPILLLVLLLVTALLWGQPSLRFCLEQSDVHLCGRLSSDLQQALMSGKLSSLGCRHLTPIFSTPG